MRSRSIPSCSLRAFPVCLLSMNLRVLAFFPCTRCETFALCSLLLCSHAYTPHTFRTAIPGVGSLCVSTWVSLCVPPTSSRVPLHAFPIRSPWVSRAFLVRYNQRALLVSSSVPCYVLLCVPHEFGVRFRPLPGSLLPRALGRAVLSLVRCSCIICGFRDVFPIVRFLCDSSCVSHCVPLCFTSEFSVSWHPFPLGSSMHSRCIPLALSTRYLWLPRAFPSVFPHMFSHTSSEVFVL